MGLKEKVMNVLLPPVSLPMVSKVRDKRLSFLFLVLQMSVLILVVYLAFSQQVWIAVRVPEIHTVVVAKAEPTDKYMKDGTAKFLASSWCRQPDKLSYYDPEHVHKPGYVHIRCLQLPEEEAYEDSGHIFFPTFIHEIDGHTKAGTAACAALKTSCGKGVHHAGLHFRYIDLPARVDGIANCECRASSNFFVAGGLAGKVGLEFEYQVPFTAGGGKHFLVGSTGQGFEKSNGIKGDGIHTWVLHHVDHAHADTTASVQKKVFKKFPPGKAATMHVDEWLRAAGIDGDSLNKLVRSNQLQKLIDAKEYDSASEAFTKVDVNSDKNLDKDEFAKYFMQGSTSATLKAISDKEFAIVDADKNNKMSATEFAELYKFTEYPTYRMVGVDLTITVNCLSNSFHEKVKDVKKGTICFVEVLPSHGWNSHRSVAYGEPLVGGVNVGSYRLRESNGISFTLTPGRGKFGEFDLYALVQGITTLLVWVSIPATIVGAFVSTCCLTSEGAVFKRSIKVETGAKHEMENFARNIVANVGTCKGVSKSEIRNRLVFALEHTGMSDGEFDHLSTMIAEGSDIDFVNKTMNMHNVTPDILAVWTRKRVALDLDPAAEDPHSVQGLLKDVKFWHEQTKKAGAQSAAGQPEEEETQPETMPDQQEIKPESV